MTTPSMLDATCVGCQTPITPDGPSVTCPRCGARHHNACWHRIGHCALPGCASPVTHQAATPIIPPTPTPTQSVYTPMPATAMAVGITMEGTDTLVVPDGWSFPPMCLATGSVVDITQRARKVEWGPSWIYILILASWLVAVVVYYCLRKTGTIHAYFSRQYEAMRRTVIIANVALFLLAFTGAIIAATEEHPALFMTLLLVSLLGPLIVAAVFLRPITISKIDNGRIWIKFRDKAHAQRLYEACLDRPA